jgi:hypothetical protein
VAERISQELNWPTIKRKNPNEVQSHSTFSETPSQEGSFSKDLNFSTLSGANGKNKDMIPHICRNGCKYYDGVEDVNDGLFKEYCDRSGRRINGSSPCSMFEGKGIKLPEGILPI